MGIDAPGDILGDSDVESAELAGFMFTISNPLARVARQL